MFNEALFFLHIIFVVAFSCFALRMGKEMLITWIAIQSVLANLFVLKQITLFQLNVTCSDVYAVGAFLTLNLLQEFYSSEIAKSAIRIAAFIQGCFLLMSQFQLLYIPSPHDTTQFAFSTLLTPYPRIVLASLAVFYFVQCMDVRVFTKLKLWLPHTPFAVRNAGCLIISQCLDTVLFSILGLYGIVTSLTDVILLSLTIKLILILAATPLTSFIKHRITA